MGLPESSQGHEEISGSTPPAHGGYTMATLRRRAKLSGRSAEEEKKSALSIQSLKTFVDPKDIAALAVFLASDSAKSISGQMLPIDGDMQKAT